MLDLRVLLLSTLFAVVSCLELESLPPLPFKVDRTIKRDLVPGRQALSRTPLNDYALVGTTVTLVCEANVAPPISRIIWFEYATTGVAQLISDDTYIIPSHPNADRYRIVDDGVDTHLHLEISGVVLQDGGTYACLDINSGPPEVFTGEAELIVIERDPVCTTSIPGNGVVVEGFNYTNNCVMNYRGGLPVRLSAQMAWSGPGPFSRSDTILPTQINSSIAFTANRNMESLFHSVVTSFYGPTNVPPGVAFNPVGYNSRWDYQQMNTFYGPSFMYATPMKPSYEVGDAITCYAYSRPESVYRWQDMDTLNVIVDEVLTVTENMAGRNSSMRCHAYNVIQGFIYRSDLSIFVYVPGLKNLVTK